MFESPQLNLFGPSICSSAASPARTSPARAKAKGSTVSDPGSRARCSDSWETSGPASSSSKTSPAERGDGCALCGDRLRLEDIERAPSISASTIAADRTGESGSSFWATPRASFDAGQSANPSRDGRSLACQVKLWPTPSVCGNYNRAGASPASGDGLSTAVNRWPTPRAETTQGGPDLMTAVQWPTPQARDEKGPSGNWQGRRSVALPNALGIKTRSALNPQWVLALMGFPLSWFDGLRPPDRKKSGSRRASSGESKRGRRSSGPSETR